VDVRNIGYFVAFKSDTRHESKCQQFCREATRCSSFFGEGSFHYWERELWLAKSVVKNSLNTRIRTWGGERTFEHLLNRQQSLCIHFAQTCSSEHAVSSCSFAVCIYLQRIHPHNLAAKRKTFHIWSRHRPSYRLTSASSSSLSTLNSLAKSSNSLLSCICLSRLKL